MARLKPRIREGGNRLWDLGEERAAAESLLNQRLGLFLILFAVIIVGGFNTQKKFLFLSVMFIGAVICWVLAYTIIRLARKIGFLTNEINSIEDVSAQKIDRKGGGRSVRFLLGYFVPIFCSTLLVLAFLVGSVGFMDSLWLPSISAPQIERKVDQVKNDIKEKIVPQPKDTNSQNFQNVNQVIANSKVYNSGRKYTQLEKSVEKEVTPDSPQVTQNNFRSVDSVMVTSQISPTKKSIPLPSSKTKTYTNSSISSGTVKSNKTDSKYFKDIRSIIVEDKSNSSPSTKKSTKRSVIFPTNPIRKDTLAQPSPNFKNIDSVIKK